jgi:hypothetical protein
MDIWWLGFEKMSSAFCRKIGVLPIFLLRSLLCKLPQKPAVFAVVTAPSMAL